MIELLQSLHDKRKSLEFEIKLTTNLVNKYKAELKSINQEIKKLSRKNTYKEIDELVSGAKTHLCVLKKLITVSQIETTVTLPPIEDEVTIGIAYIIALMQILEEHTNKRLISIIEPIVINIIKRMIKSVLVKFIWNLCLRNE